MSDAETEAAIPRAAVSAAIFRDGRLLLVKRARPPSAGLWSFPGGHIETGEAAIEAARREVLEETGIEARLAGVAGIKDVVHRNDSGGVLFHRVIIVFWGVWVAGEAQAGSDAAAAVWYEPGEIAQLALTEGLEVLIEAATERLHSQKL